MVLGRVLIKSFVAFNTTSMSKFLSRRRKWHYATKSMKTLRAQQISSSKSIWQSICGALSEEQIDSHTTPTSLILWCGNFQKCLLTWSSNFHGFLVVISGERVLQNERELKRVDFGPQQQQVVSVYNLSNLKRQWPPLSCPLSNPPIAMTISQPNKVVLVSL